LQDEADIRALFDAQAGSLDEGILRDYYRLFGLERELDRLLGEAKRR
jgi:hypothetical protein